MALSLQALETSEAAAPDPRQGGRKVAAALSGGVDSAVAAALLLERGDQLIGMTLRLHDEPAPSRGRHGSCCAPEDLEDARRVARQLGLPFYLLSAEDRFERHVVGPFVEAYLRGETPLPCAACNRHLKFGHLLRRARAIGHRLCTGHFARIGRSADGRYQLLRARDERRDQSYFLYGLSQEALAQLEFPVGELTKDEVRAAAQRLGLRVAQKPDSQELCFAPRDYGAFVEARAATGPVAGAFVDEAGRSVGSHRGIHRYTVGQRRGLPVVGRLEGQQARYVRRIDARTNEIELGPGASLERHELEVDGVSYPGGAPSQPFEALVRIRHRHAGELATVTPLSSGRARVRFRTPVRAPAAGQAAVFYAGDVTVGGGTILPA